MKPLLIIELCHHCPRNHWWVIWELCGKHLRAWNPVKKHWNPFTIPLVSHLRTVVNPGSFFEPKTLQSFYNVTTVLSTINLSIMHAWVVPFAKTFKSHLKSYQNITILQLHQTHHHGEPFLCKIILLNKLCVWPHVCQTFTFFNLPKVNLF